MTIKITRRPLSEWALMVLMIISLTDKVNGVRLPSIKMYICGALIILMYYTGVRGESVYASERKRIKYLMQAFLVPYFLLWVWSVFVIFLNGSGFRYFTRASADTIYEFIAIFTAAYAILTFGKRAFDIIWSAAVISYLFNIICGFVVCGWSGVVSYYLDISVVSSINNYLEQHELIFIFGLFTIYYFMSIKETPKNKWKLIISLLFVFIGYKRILFAALAAMFLLMLLLRRLLRTNNAQAVSWVINLTTIAVFTVCFVWLYALKTDLITELSVTYNVDFMSRLRMYSFFADYYTLGISYLGRGVGATEKILAASGQFNLNSVHSDIYRNYIEYGFIPFVAWLLYYINIFPRKLKMGSDQRDTVICFLLMLYMIINALTDNVCRYYNFQMIIFMIIIYVYLEQNDKKLFGFETEGLGDE
ncbi:MAG: hypothetical protein LIP01_02520 [Tannerellaceae bacterium]|nr:hypothetical protein [Tannerellaceae bacterium]